MVQDSSGRVDQLSAVPDRPTAYRNKPFRIPRYILLVTEILTQRRLNRATLARQYLLERAPARAIDAIEHLGGMQSQAPLAPYVGLWTRLRDFAPDELSALTEERRVVRLH